MKRKLWVGDDFYDDWYSEPEAARQSMTVEESEPDVIDSGLLDAEGNPLVRYKQRIGFI